MSSLVKISRQTMSASEKEKQTAKVTTQQPAYDARSERVTWS